MQYLCNFQEDIGLGFTSLHLLSAYPGGKILLHSDFFYYCLNKLPAATMMQSPIGNTLHFQSLK